MIRPPRARTRTLMCALAATALSWLVTGGAAAETGDGVSATGATLDRVGWWHEKNVSTSTPAASVTVPPPPGVPAGTLAVGAVNGEADRIAALGIVPDAAPGDTITAFTLSIAEADPPAVNAGSDDAAVVACPITSFWVPAENGTWDTRPSYDCDLASAPGTRDADGVWTFDLLPIGALWTDPTGTVTADGVVLVEAVDSPTSFQAVFATEGEGAIVVNVESAAGTGGTDGGFEPPPPVGGGDFGTDPGGFEVPALGTGGVAVPDLPAPGPTASTTTAPATLPPPTLAASQRPNILGNLPGGLVVGIPAFLVLMALTSVSLGPLGDPVAATRQGGVSRALARARSPLTTPHGQEAP